MWMVEKYLRWGILFAGLWLILWVWSSFGCSTVNTNQMEPYLVRDSFVYKDLYKYRNMSSFFERHPEFFTLYPELLNEAAREMLTVDGVSKRRKQRKIFWGALRQRSPLRMALDMYGAWRSIA